jgi:hypothetical protein
MDEIKRLHIIQQIESQQMTAGQATQNLFGCLPEEAAIEVGRTLNMLLG